MKVIFKHIKGDRTIWALVAILALFSFMPVYSASANLVSIVGGSTLGYLIKHVVLLIMGFAIIYAVHKIPYRYFSGGSVLLLPIVFFLLIYTLAQGTTIGGAYASRWIRIPFIGVGFQTSTLAGLVLMVYTARYLAKNKGLKIIFKESLLQLWVPVALILMLILPANFSTTAIIFFMILVVAFVGGYPLKYIGYILGVGFLVLALFILIAKAFPDAMPNRVNTWGNRIENFSDSDSKEAYQVEKAKIAIATGGPVGVGPGKSVQKNFLPQSNSDFVFAVITEEYGLLGASGVVLLYMALFRRFVRIARRAHTKFGTLLVLAAASGMILQTLVNMGVATNLMPVTGQTLPFLSAGGSSIWMTCIALGIILSVSHTDVEKVVGVSAQSQEENQNAKAHV